MVINNSVAFNALDYRYTKLAKGRVVGGGTGSTVQAVQLLAVAVGGDWEEDVDSVREFKVQGSRVQEYPRDAWARFKVQDKEKGTWHGLGARNACLVPAKRGPGCNVSARGDVHWRSLQ